MIKVGISQGDINGIGYEIIMKTLLDNRILEICTPIVYGSSKVAAYHRKALNITNFSLNSIKNPEEANSKRSNIINCLDDNVRVELGKSSSIAGEASFRALERAVSDLKDNKIDVLVTAPINKNNIHSEKFSFFGHTDYLRSMFEVNDVLMLLVGERMKVGVVTEHIPVSEVPSKITHENVLNKLRILNSSLVKDFAIRKPRIAVLGLNPHAGDEGLIGNEDKDVIAPVIDNAREENILALGPFPADGLFGSEIYNKFDAILAMYHDQGLAPFKALSFDDGVNFTAGLPVIRTSPAHGTAYEIAGKGEASSNSFRQALYLACDIYRKRSEHNKLTSNVLEQQDITGI